MSKKQMKDYEVTLSMTSAQHRSLIEMLFPRDGAEVVAIGLCGTSTGGRVQKLLLRELHQIPAQFCQSRTPFSISWSTDALEPLLERAEQQQLTVVKFHSHPNGLPGFSARDDESDRALLPALQGWLESDFPVASVVVLPDGGLIGRYSRGSRFQSLACISVIGDDLKFFRPPAASSMSVDFTESHAQLFGERTIEELGRMSIAVVGCSGTGSPVIEQLVRYGVGRLVLVDDDLVEVRNLNRILNTCRRDAKRKRSKVEALAAAIKRIGLGTKVEVVRANLWTADAIRKVAECDAVFGCVDSIDGRLLLNTLATYYMLPYFDLGVRLEAIPEGADRGKIREVCGTVNYIQPGKSSLMSRGLVDLKKAAEAGLRRNDPAAFSQQIRDQYISGVAERRPAVITVNMFIAALAVHEFLCRLHPYRESPNSEYAALEFSLASMEFLPEPESAPCPILQNLVGRGDTMPLLGFPEVT